MLQRIIPGALSVALLLAAGCGEPGSPQPPSLNLPVPVRNLAARRTGDVVHLTWTTTSKTTDHTTPSGIVLTRICRMQGTAGLCDRVGDQRRALGGAASYDDTLPINLASGAPALLTYYVELVNHAQKSAGRSNAAYTAEGAPPPALTGLAAGVRAEGVVLHWDAATGCGGCSMRIERQLQGAPVPKPAGRGPAAGFTALGAAPPPSPHQLLELPAGTHFDTQALDHTAAFGQTYAYQLRRVEALILEGHAMEIDGQQSAPVTIQTRDTFPPAVPLDLAAVADLRSKAIDLSWSAGTEPDLAGYAVYRRDGAASLPPQRISGSTPLATAAYHDAQVRAGVAYAYSVSAVDQGGNQSARSAEAVETLPPPR